MKKITRGFSLIEILIFITILSFIFIAAAALGTASLRSSQTAQNKILATRYAEELMDWLRGQKESDWEGFTSNVINSGGLGSDVSYCFDIEPVSAWQPADLCTSSQVISGLFERFVILNYNESTERMTVTVRVEWEETGNDYRVELNGVFAQIEDL